MNDLLYRQCRLPSSAPQSPDEFAAIGEEDAGQDVFFQATQPRNVDDAYQDALYVEYSREVDPLASFTTSDGEDSIRATLDTPRNAEAEHRGVMSPQLFTTDLSSVLSANISYLNPVWSNCSSIPGVTSENLARNIPFSHLNGSLSPSPFLPPGSDSSPHRSGPKPDQRRGPSHSYWHTYDRESLPDGPDSLRKRPSLLSGVSLAATLMALSPVLGRKRRHSFVWKPDSDDEEASNVADDGNPKRRLTKPKSTDDIVCTLMRV